MLVAFAGLAVGVAGAAQRADLGVGGKRPVPPRAFQIASAKLVRPLRPGTSQAVDVRLTNPYRYSLAVTAITVAVVVDPTHARAGRDGRRDFRSIGMPPRSYPIRVWARRTVSLRQLRVRRLPRVAMVARPRNQDACKGARLTLRFAGSAHRWGAGRRR